MRTAVERAFTATASRQLRIGAELELHVRRRPDLGHDLLGGSLTYEPGGQVEVSVPPQRSVAHLVRVLNRCLETIAAQTPTALCGIDPWRDLAEVPLVLTTPRYLAMQDVFDRGNEHGRRMMRLTASLQVCVDLLPGPAGVEQWLVANLAGPALVAAYSGDLERTRVWLDMDATRTAYDGRHLDVGDPVGAYTAFAEAAERLPIPEAEDDAYHLSTLFPPVRPRGGYLELRYLDSQPPTADLLGAVWSLMYDQRLRREALELLLPTLPVYREAWTRTDPADLLAIVAARREVAA